MQRPAGLAVLSVRSDPFYHQRGLPPALPLFNPADIHPLTLGPVSFRGVSTAAAAKQSIK